MFGGDFSSAISQNKLLPIAQDTLQEYAPGVVNALGDYLKASTVGDKIYGLPVNKDMAQARAKFSSCLSRYRAWAPIRRA